MTWLPEKAVRVGTAVVVWVGILAVIVGMAFGLVSSVRIAVWEKRPRWLLPTDFLLTGLALACVNFALADVVCYMAQVSRDLGITSGKHFVWLSFRSTRTLFALDAAFQPRWLIPLDVIVLAGAYWLYARLAPNAAWNGVRGNRAWNIPLVVILFLLAVAIVVLWIAWLSLMSFCPCDTISGT